jgi:hypothetical protein
MAAAKFTRESVRLGSYWREPAFYTVRHLDNMEPWSAGRGFSFAPRSLVDTKTRDFARC